MSIHLRRSTCPHLSFSRNWRLTHTRISIRQGRLRQWRNVNVLMIAIISPDWKCLGLSNGWVWVGLLSGININWNIVLRSFECELWMYQFRKQLIDRCRVIFRFQCVAINTQMNENYCLIIIASCCKLPACGFMHISSNPNLNECRSAAISWQSRSFELQMIRSKYIINHLSTAHVQHVNRLSSID